MKPHQSAPEMSVQQSNFQQIEGAAAANDRFLNELNNLIKSGGSTKSFAKLAESNQLSASNNGTASGTNANTNTSSTVNNCSSSANNRSAVNAFAADDQCDTQQELEVEA